MRISGVVAASILVPCLLGACGDDDADTGSADETTTTAEAPLEGTLTVLAAASLKGAFEDIEAAFEDEYPDVDVKVTTDGSANLATAIIEGGVPADVFASADEPNLQKVVDAGQATDGDGVIFVTNQLRIVVEEGNPLGIESLEDLSDPEISLSLCRPEVPCGSYATKAFEAAGLPVPPAGTEDQVSGVITKVSLGEADAGLVYATDVLAAEGAVDGVDLAADEQVEATYPAAALIEAPNPEAAAAFVAFLTASEAQAILEEHGFGLP
jgi:molybdate transport system substrate-binding protein